MQGLSCGRVRLFPHTSFLESEAPPVWEPAAVTSLDDAGGEEEEGKCPGCAWCTEQQVTEPAPRSLLIGGLDPPPTFGGQSLLPSLPHSRMLLGELRQVGRMDFHTHVIFLTVCANLDQKDCPGLGVVYEAG